MTLAASPTPANRPPARGRRITERRTDDAGRGGRTSPRRDRLATFRPAILGIRGGTLAISVALSASAFTANDWRIIGWSAVVVAYNVLRILQPVRYYDDTPSLLRVLVEVAIHVVAVAATGFWDSPFVFSLLTAIMVAGFARGFAFAVRVGLASALAIALPDAFTATIYGTDELRTTVQWSSELLLVALIAGYARRITGEADRQHTLALDRLGRLADANELLFSLHRVAQSLPASLDLDQALDSTMGRLRDLFRCDTAALLLFDETGGGWLVARAEGARLPDRIDDYELPPPCRTAIRARALVTEPDLGAGEGPGLVTTSRSGLYAVLPARESIVGMVVLEHPSEQHFSERDIDLLNGFVEPAALAIDNARWFARLRTVGADEERTRIARDLHDRIGQSLAYLAFELDRIVKSDSQGRSVTPSLGRLRNDVRGVIGDVRDTLYDLRTDVSDTSDVPSTLRSFLERVEGRSDLTVTLDDHVTGRLPLLQEREFWRIAQEAITNVERHAHATRVHVRWWCDGRSAVLQVADDGVGFAPARAGRLDSYGLMGIRERAGSIGATLDVESTEGTGTTIRCLLLGEDRR